MSPELRKKALPVLREGRLQLLHVTCRRTAHDVDEVIAKVQSSRDGGPTYAVDLSSGTWECTCRGGSTRDCAHIAAVMLVTGHAAAGPS